MRRSGITAPLRRPLFRRLAATYALNEMGDWMGVVALSVLVYDATGSALATTALFLGTRFLPAFLAPLLVTRIERPPPRLVLPLVSVLSGSYLLVVNYVLVFVVALATGTDLSFALLLGPLGMIMTLLTTLFAATLLAGVHVYFRDTRYLVQTVLMLALYVTPSFYPLTRAPSQLRLAAEINPMTGPIELTRRGLGIADPTWLHTVAISGGWLVVLIVGTLWLYRRFDRLFSDLM